MSKLEQALRNAVKRLKALSTFDADDFVKVEDLEGYATTKYVDDAAKDLLTKDLLTQDSLADMIDAALDAELED